MPHSLPLNPLHPGFGPRQTLLAGEDKPIQRRYLLFRHNIIYKTAEVISSTVKNRGLQKYVVPEKNNLSLLMDHFKYAS